MYISIFMEKTDIGEIIGALKELASIKRDFCQVNPDVGKVALEHEAVYLDKLASEFKAAVRYSDEIPESSDELKAIDELVSQIETSTSWHHCADSRAEKLRWYIEDIQANKERIRSNVATFVTDIIIKFQAVKFQIEQAKDGSYTHRQKNTRMEIVLETISNIVACLEGIDTNSSFWDETPHWDRGYSFQKLIYELHRKESENRDLRKQLGQVKTETSVN